MEKVLVTGYLGIIGNIIFPRLSEIGYEAEGYDLKDGDDILDTEKLTEKLKGKYACIHLAGIPAPWDLPWEEYEKTNIKGTQSVITACKKAKVKRLIYTSSGDIYGLCTGKTKPDKFPISEDNTLLDEKEECFYSLTKRACEKHLEEASSKDFTTIAFRLESPVPEAAVLSYHFFISIGHDNLLEAFRSALEPSFKGYGVFNIGDKEIHPSIGDNEIASLKAQYDVPDYTKERQSLYDISKAISILGYNPK